MGRLQNYFSQFLRRQRGVRKNVALEERAARNAGAYRWRPSRFRHDCVNSVAMLFDKMKPPSVVLRIPRSARTRGQVTGNAK